jgi:hypothetical protein
VAAHSFIRINGEYFFPSRESYYREFASLFRDSELLQETDDEGHLSTYEYSLPAGDLMQRMNLLGILVTESRSTVKANAPSEKDYSDFQSWLRLLISSFVYDNVGVPEEPDWIHYGIDPRAVLCTILSECPSFAEVALDRIVGLPTKGSLQPLPADVQFASRTSEVLQDGS